MSHSLSNVRRYAAAGTLMVSLLSFGFGSFTALAAPNAITDGATGISSTDATLNGTNGDTAADGSSFWASTSTFDTSSPTVPSGVFSTPDLGPQAANAAFSALLSSTGITVTANTTYYFAAWSKVGGTWYPGAVESFTTAPAAPANTAPVADDQSVSTNEDTAVAITLSATDADSDALTYATTSSPTSGTLTGTAPNLTYTPNSGFTGTDSFTFKANDGTADSNAATVTITVNSTGGGTPSSSTTVVTPNAMNGWYFYDDQTDTQSGSSADHDIVTGPGTPPAGTGSVHLTKTTTDKYGIATAQFAGTALSDITALSYSTYRASGTSAQVPSLGFDVDSDTTDADTSYQGRLTYEPYFTQTVNTGAWQTWDTLANTGTGNWWFSHASLSGGAASVCTQANPCTWSELVAAYPHAALRTPGQLILRTNGADGEAFDGNVDNLTVGISNADTTFDFDPTAPAACNDSTFDDFTLGSVNDQNGWSATGPYDQAIVDNTYGYSSFGCKSLRVSDAVTSGSFGDWIFAAPHTDPVGETSTGATKTHFETQFDIAAASTAPETGLEVSVAPTDVNGSRMSYLRFEDSASGINVFFDDVTDAGPVGTTATFNESQIATNLDRTIPHTVKLTLDTVEGASNDVVKVYIDGSLVKTGTSWEDYYRYDPEQTPSGNTLPAIDTMIIQARGSAHSADAGSGFLFDNLALSNNDSTVVTPPTPTQPVTVGGSGHGGSSVGTSGNGTSSGTGTGTVGGGQVLGASTFNFTYDLTVGATGTAVTELQKILIADGYLHIAAPTGYFGPLTQAAVKLYQAAHGIITTGYVGPLTRAALNAGTIQLSDAERAAILATLADILKKLALIQQELNNIK